MTMVCNQQFQSGSHPAVSSKAPALSLHACYKSCGPRHSRERSAAEEVDVDALSAGKSVSLAANLSETSLLDIRDKSLSRTDLLFLCHHDKKDASTLWPAWSRIPEPCPYMTTAHGDCREVTAGLEALASKKKVMTHMDRPRTFVMSESHICILSSAHPHTRLLHRGGRGRLPSCQQRQQQSAQGVQRAAGGVAAAL